VSVFAAELANFNSIEVFYSITWDSWMCSFSYEFST